MLKQILSAYRTHGIIKACEEKIREMFSHSKAIYTSSALALLEQKEVAYDLYERDQQINALVVHVRKLIVEHLSISAYKNVSGELIFLKVITDLERVGDYAKNLLDLAKMLPQPLSNSDYYQRLLKVYQQTESHFDKAERSLFDGQDQDARDVVAGHLVINKTCKALLRELMKDQQVSVPDAIALALTARYFKRVSSHLKNVASTAINPFSHIGYMHPDAPTVPGEDND
jgi:phosphate uptake regulator